LNPDKLFKLYRSNLEELDLEDQFKHKLNSSRDYAFHTCDQSVNPAKLEEFEYFSILGDVRSMDWKTKYDRDFKKLVLTRNFDFEKLDQYLKEYKGLWYLSPKIDDINSNLNFLEIFNPGISKAILNHVTKFFGSFTNIELFDRYSIHRSYNPDAELRARIFATEGFKKILKEYWNCDHFTEKKCLLCGGKFFPQSNADWVGYTNPNYCGYCLQLAFHSGHGCWEIGNEKKNYQTLNLTSDEVRQNSINALKGFVEFSHFIPNSKFKAKKLRSLGLENMSTEDTNLYLKWWAVLPRFFLVKDYFKSWSHLLNDGDLLTAPLTKGKGGYKSIASDGHLCLSSPERTICEFLTEFKIDHEKEPPYPKIMDNHLGDSRADWLIQDTYVEFAGMMGVKEYELKMKRKVTFAKANGIKLVVITPKDIDNLADIFKEFIKF
jgi:hypothetical protein